MSVLAKDISQWQGNWQDTGEPIILIKMSGGDAGLYMDSKAAANYTAAKGANKAVGGYHFIGWVLGAIAEATYFLQAMSPLAENDVYCLDIESIKTGDPVAYVTEMVNFLHDKINVYPLLYMNLSTLRAYDWSPLLKLCGLWLADWNNDPNGTIPNVPVYVMQQYSDGPNYDHDEWFGTVEEFNKYGYHAPAPAQAPAPVTSTPPAPSPEVNNAPSQPVPPVTPVTAAPAQQSNDPVEPPKLPVTEAAGQHSTGNPTDQAKEETPTPPETSQVTVSPTHETFWEWLKRLFSEFFHA